MKKQNLYQIAYMRYKKSCELKQEEPWYEGITWYHYFKWAKNGERIKKQEKLVTAKEALKLVGYELKNRKEVTDWKYRKKETLKYKIDGKVYCVLKNEPAPVTKKNDKQKN